LFTQHGAPEGAATSRDLGRYYVSLAPGQIHVKASKSGYYVAKRRATLSKTGVRRLDIIMSPKLRNGQLRFVLTWKSPQIYLDAFLITPTGCVVSGANRVCHDRRTGARAVYDMEKCAHRGPQTITVRRFKGGGYWYFVKQTSKAGKMSSSRIVVRVISECFKSKTRIFTLSKYGKVIGKGNRASWCVTKVSGAMMRKGLRTKSMCAKALSNCAGQSSVKVIKRLQKAKRRMLEDKVGTKVKTNIRIRKLSPRSAACQSKNVQDGVDYQGSDLIKGGLKSPNAATCCKKCAATTGCKFWTQAKDKNVCWVKSTAKGWQRQSNRISGKMPGARVPPKKRRATKVKTRRQIRTGRRAKPKTKVHTRWQIRTGRGPKPKPKVHTRVKIGRAKRPRKQRAKRPRKRRVGIRIGKPSKRASRRRKAPKRRLSIRVRTQVGSAKVPFKVSRTRSARQPHMLNLKGRTATQSSTGYGGKASRAVDGNTNGRYSAGSVTHTKRQRHAWWKVNLGAKYSIQKVVVWNRVDCCQSRLNNFNVFVGSRKCGSVGRAHRKNTVQCGSKSGRSVKVQLRGTNYLQIAEVQVYGARSGRSPSVTNGCCGGRVVSRGKRAKQSSTGHGGSASRAVDGNTNGRYGARSCTHTKRQRHAWWRVELGRTMSICKVVVWNRVDCCQSRLNNFNVFVGSRKCGSVGRAHRKNTVQCGCKSGRSVKVQLSGTDYLTLCEVQVYGK
jgi:hypothetical protein